MTMWIFRKSRILLLLVSCIRMTNGYEHSLRGPSFLMEPPPRVEFSNTSGAWIDCTASGSPSPDVTWLGVDGSPLQDVPGVRTIRRNGTLVLLPFSAAGYRQDIHSTVYRCRVSNSVGQIVSRDTQVRAVVVQGYQANVRVMPAARGCTAVLRCDIPSFVKEWVKVVSWVQDDVLYFYPKHQQDGKYHVLPNGDLLVHNIQYNDDEFKRYRCRTMHKLTRAVVPSSTAYITKIEAHSFSAPNVFDHPDVVQVLQDEGAVLICSAQACPSPEYRWYLLSGPEPILITPSARVRQMGPVLAIEAATQEDAGIYRCAVSNVVGEKSIEIRLVVSTPLQVEVTPNVLTMHLGGTAEFNCNIATSGYHIGPYTITWYKDGRILPGSSRHNTDHYVINGVGRDDRGMYQCLVRRPEGDTAQAVAELQLGDAPPVMLYSFIEQTLQPGPSVSLKCTAAGNPTPQFSWNLDGFPLPDTARFMIGQYVTVHGDVISHVNISTVNVEDGGEYACVAVNRAGKVSHSARLNVYGVPSIRIIPPVTAVAGETLRLKCPVAGYPIDDIYWEQGGKTLPVEMRQKVEPDGTLVISPVEKTKDMGMYTCWSKGKYGRSQRRSGEVTVIVPPKLHPIQSKDAFNVGDRVTLTCTVTAGDEQMTLKWFKDGRDVSPNTVSISALSSFTSVLMVDSLTQEHHGNYTCEARNEAGSATETAQLVVNVPPIIEPFSFQDGLSEGMRTRTVCGVSQGDPPLTISWLKDGAGLPSQLGANFSTLDAYSSLLNFPSLTSAHSGDYTCVATNPAQETRYTAKLQVKVPPRWIIEPSSLANVLRNRHLMLHCQAQGVPTPTVVWKKAIGGKSGEYEEIRERLYTKIFPNGSLLVQNVKEDREGNYMCQASNGIGQPIGKIVQLVVNSPPFFPAPSRQYSVKKGDSAIILCEVNGDKAITVTWLRIGEIELSPQTNYRVTIKLDETHEGVSSELHISNVDSSDSGTYFCEARNDYGRERQMVQLVVQEPPNSPEGLEIISLTSRSANIHWKRPSVDLTDVTKYFVQYREGDGSWLQKEIIDQYSAIIDNLKPATQYSIRLVAEGPAGKSPPSGELFVKTEPQRPAGPPVHVSVRPQSSSEILVRWSPPQPELRHGDIQGYKVGFRESPDLRPNGGNYNFTDVTWDGEEGGELLLTALKKYTRYSIVVQAYNQIGTGPLSEAISTQTMEDVPSMPPEDVRCTVLSAQSLQVSWQPPQPQYSNGKIQGYKVHLEPIHDENLYLFGPEDVEPKKTQSLTLIINKLRKYTNYTIQVLASTVVGDGVLSRPTYCRTEEDAPGPPADIKVVVMSSSTLLVSWMPPLEPNGIITKYYLYARTVDKRDMEVKLEKHQLIALQTSFEDKNLSVMQYQYYVTAFTKVGEGQSSRVATQVPTTIVPARISSFGGQVMHPQRGLLTLPCVAVGQPPPRREWFKGDQPLRIGAGPNYQVMESGEVVLTNLQNTDTANYTCQVENSQGSERITYTLTVQVPPPSPVLYISSATSRSVHLQWKPVGTGGAFITGYTLSYRKDNGEQGEIALPRGITVYEIKNLRCGTTYHLAITAQNKIGSSLASISRTVRTQGQAPGVPQGTTLIQPNSTSVLLRLHVWPDNGCPLLYFIIQYRASIDVTWTRVPHSLKPQKRFTINGLMPASVYQLKIEAHNVAGSSMAEFTFVTLTKDGIPPPADIVAGSHHSQYFLTDVRIIIPFMVAVIALCGALAAAAFCWRSRSIDDRSNGHGRPYKEHLDNQHNAEAQRERYYATIHKVSLQNGEKIPETSEDISPYATFQLTEAGPPTNALLHSFMYHEQALTEGCASPPPSVRTDPKGLGKMMTGFQGGKPNNGRRRRSRGRKHEADSDDSESDPELITSSRTESSNQLDATRVSKPGYLYHGAQSSTSSDISPMSEIKSLPRRGRNRSNSRWLSSSKHSPGSRRPLPSIAHTTLPLPTDAAIPERMELSEAECDIDTIKRLKLGLRSSLWARPSAHSSQSDYSIAV